jgi:hypothetical protein
MRPDYLARLLNEIGIPTAAGRTSAIRQHLLETPAPVVADALSYSQGTTASLAAQAGGTVSRYAPGDHAPVTRPPAGKRRAMTAPSLPAALRAAAEGLYALEAATGLIIAHGTWLAADALARLTAVALGIGTTAACINGDF